MLSAPTEVWTVRATRHSYCHRRREGTPRRGARNDLRLECREFTNAGRRFVSGAPDLNASRRAPILGRSLR
ncbi:hypothetical protein B5F89_02955 [Collinsella sp. An307]|nr:hypothetical protein B5F89_02955 [Collinsella sp. An307]